MAKIYNGYIDTTDSNYTLTIKTMETRYNTTLDYNGVPFAEGKSELIKNFIHDYFYFREIGYEEIGRFNFAFNRKMRLIMPVFNKLFEISDSIENYFENADYLTEQEIKGNIDTQTDSKEDSDQSANGKQTTTGESVADNNVTSENDRTNTETHSGTDKTVNQESGTTQTNNTTSGNLNQNRFKVDSDLPQDMITTAEIKQNTWATTAGKEQNSDTTAGESDTTVTHGKKDDSTTTHGHVVKNVENISATETAKLKNTIDNLVDTVNTMAASRTLANTENQNTLNNLVRHVKGNIGNKYVVELMPMVKNAILNVPEMIISELEPLFMGVW